MTNHSAVFDGTLGVPRGLGPAVSLGDLMHRMPMGIFYELAGKFALCEEFSDRAMKAVGPQGVAVPVSDEDKKKWLGVFKAAAAEPKFMALIPLGAAAINRIVDALESPTTSTWKLAELIRDLERRMVDELDQQIYLKVDANVAGLVAHPGNGFERAIDAFPEIKEDVAEASLCIAFDRNSAAVFHSMRVLELGLRAFSESFGITGSELENWKNVIDQIEKRIKEEEKLPKSPAKSERVRWHSESASQFRYFKDAWRNHISHARTSYDGYQARSVYGHVREFMNALADGLGADSSDPSQVTT